MSSSSSIKSREVVVEALVAAALNGLADECRHQDRVTAGETYSAIFTMALRAVASARDMGIDMSQFRGAIEKIWAELPKESVS